MPTDLDAVRKFYTFRSLDHFVEVYLVVVGLLQDAEDIRLLTYEVAVLVPGLDPCGDVFGASSRGQPGVGRTRP